MESKRRVWIAIAIFCSFALLATFWLSVYSGLEFPWQKHDTIIDLQELPLRQVRLRGVVTYVDNDRKRLWLQDETGALGIDIDPIRSNVHFGEMVRVEAEKAHAYDPNTGFSSLGLTNIKIKELKSQSRLPIPISAAIPTLFEQAKNGIRVDVTGVIHGAIPNGNGRVKLYLGDGGREVEAFVPGDWRQFAKWLNATVRITGVLEVLLDEGGSPRSQLIWAQNSTDVAKISDAPIAAPSSSIRSLYATRKNISSHLVRLSGRVLQQETAKLILIEDQWGTVRCTLENAAEFAAGTPIDVTGFPLEDGLRIDLAHAVATQTAPHDLKLSPQPTRTETIADVRNFDEEVVATAPPVTITGTITYVDTEWRQLFIQDSTGGIFVKYAGSATPLFQGERIRVLGLVNPGDFAPVIVAPKFTLLTTAPLPKPIPMTLRAASGVLDSRYAQVEGVVHPLRGRQNPRHLTFDLYTSLGPVHVTLSPDASQSNKIQMLEDATVRVRGVVAELFNSRKQLIGLTVSVSSLSDIDILEPGDPNPFTKRTIPINKLFRYSPNARFDHRVVVRGSVTMLSSTFFYIQDGTGGIRVEGDTTGVHLDDVVDAAGYASAIGYSPVLTDATVRVRPEVSAVDPQSVTAEMMSDGRFDSELVSVEATVLSVDKSPGARTLLLRADGRIFQALLYLMDSDQLFLSPQEGAIVRLTGICSVEVGRSTTYKLLRKDPVGFKVIIRSPSDVQILKSGGWWTLGDMLVLSSVLLLVVVLSVTRILALRRRVMRQSEQLRMASEKANAIRDLIRATQQVRLQKQFTSRVSVSGADELGLLGTEFNHMLEELHARDLAMAEAEEKLQQQALTDALTGLPNRRLLSDRLKQSIAGTKRDGSLLAVLYIDLDGFKLVNDSFGHKFGDTLLVQVAERLTSRIRQSDTLARLGGDEFAVVLNRVKAAEDAEMVGNTLLKVLAEPFEINGQEITIGASVGICLFPLQARNESELLQYADSAMYAAKRSGKNRVTVYTADLGESVRERLTLENQLRRAIEDHAIEVHYQPEFEIGSGKLVRFEALARWNHPTLGSISPVKFIPIAEETGLIIPLGEHILKRACVDARNWQAIANRPVQVAVNVSSVQFCRDSFVDEVETVLKQTELNPKLLQLELTESVMLHGIERAGAIIRRLQSIGVSVAIDDFGTGYSALSYLPKLAFNALKIDRGFMKEIMQRAETRAMVRSLIVLAQELGMKVIVEGIETDEQLKLIQEMGGNEAQGYLLGRPTPNPISHLLPHSSEPSDRAAKQNAKVSLEFM
ncbi:MAG TPA: EAL domain-containing protein [Terriglobales bacterium]|nr:EAL domain-containing protein [Terriglobales bacterium]